MMTTALTIKLQTGRKTEHHPAKFLVDFNNNYIEQWRKKFLENLSFIRNEYYYRQQPCIRLVYSISKKITPITNNNNNNDRSYSRGGNVRAVFRRKFYLNTMENFKFIRIGRWTKFHNSTLEYLIFIMKIKKMKNNTTK